MSKKLSRRRLLGGLGGSVLAGSFCDLVGRPARAAEAGGAKRLIVIYTPDGTYSDIWAPKATGNGGFDFEAGSMLEPLAPHKDDLIIIDGLNIFNTPQTLSCQHAYGLGAMLTNVAQKFYLYGGSAADGGVGTTTNGMSIDQYVASFIGNDTRFRSLELGVQTNTGSLYTDDSYTRMVYSAPGIPVVSDDNPSHVYSRMFESLLAGNDTLTKRRRSVLDIAYRDLGDLQSRLGIVERSKLDLHLQALEDIEKSWGGEITCIPPEAPDVDQFSANSMFPEVTTAQIDLLVSALACGMTNVGTLQLSQTVSEMVMTWLGTTTDWHGLSHAYTTYSSDPVQEYIDGTRWFMEQVTYLIDRLKSFPDPDTDGGTLFDNTVILVCHELSDSVSHSLDRNQFILAGSAGGQWATGKYHEVEGESHGKLLVSIARAFGIDIDVYGDEASGTGPLEVLS